MRMLLLGVLPFATFVAAGCRSKEDYTARILIPEVPAAEVRPENFLVPARHENSAILDARLPPVDESTATLPVQEIFRSRVGVSLVLLTHYAPVRLEYQHVRGRFKGEITVREFLNLWLASSTKAGAGVSPLWDDDGNVAHDFGYVAFIYDRLIVIQPWPVRVEPEGE